MDTISQQIFNLITNNPGNLIYHLVLAFSILGALQAAIYLWRHDEFPQGRRMVVGLGLLLLTRLVLLAAAIWVQIGGANPHILLPVTDRAVMAFGLIIIIWLWTFPEPLKLADTASSLLGLLVLTVFVLNQVWWSAHQGESAFNAQLASIGWEVLATLLIILGSILLLVRGPNGSRYGLAMMFVLALGHIGQMLYPDMSSDYPGVVRVFEMAAFPLLWTIPNRFNIPIAKTSRSGPYSVPIEEKRKYGVKPEIFHTILSLSAKSKQALTCQKMAKLLAETLLADIGLVMLPPDEDGQILFECGYDLIRETHLPPVMLSVDQVPLLVSAMEHMRPIRLPASSTSIDLDSLGKHLEIGRTGHMLAAFVPSLKGNVPLMGFVLISPYSDRRWSREDQAYLNKIATTLANNLRHSEELEKNQKELDITKQNLQSFQTLLQETQAENEGLRTELGNISKQAVQELERETASLLEKYKESQGTITHLQNEKTRLEEIEKNLTVRKDAKTTDSAHLEEELKLALTEIAQLRKGLAETENQFLELKDAIGDPENLSEDQIEVFTSVAQELRQPMSSIIGYADLLLGESVGILGALQRKFLERIKASTERMDTLLDDLFQVVTLDSEGVTLRPEPVDLGSVVDEALAVTRNKLKERGIVIRVDFPDIMPQLIADRDALDQILIQLLKNAGAATPENGEIFLRASIYQTENAEDYALMEVADQGGGIPKEDLPRVFSRLYRADNPLIPGIGDTGVGLSIVKALVEAHNGRIWVDTEIGKGSTFSLLIPLSNEKTAPKNGISAKEVNSS